MYFKKVRPKREPSGCIQKDPTNSSISLGGVWVNLSAISRSQGIDKSYLSRIFSGERPNPTISYIKKISAALGMSPDELMVALEDRYELIKKRHTEMEILHLTRIIEEDTEDLKQLSKGKPPIPRMPGDRLPAAKYRQ